MNASRRRFLRAGPGLPALVGPYGWCAESAWTDAGDPNCASTCGDRLPDSGEVAPGVQHLEQTFAATPGPVLARALDD